jgi:hypothetical protein
MSISCTISYCGEIDVQRGVVEPAGDPSRHVLDLDAARGMITGMFDTRAGAGMRVVELGQRIALVHGYLLGATEAEHGLLNTFEAAHGEDEGDIHRLADMIYAMCVTYPEICSPAVASVVEAFVASGRAGILEHYAADELG